MLPHPAPPQPRTATLAGAADFIPRGRWQLDEACGICGRGFVSVLRGRHHCRHCGMSVCGRHSRNREIVPSSLSSLRQRVCDQCQPACQRGVTRPRRRTLGTRTISVRFDGEEYYSSDSKKTTITTITTATTECSSTITDGYSEPVTPLNLPARQRTPPPRPQQQRRPTSPREHLTLARSNALGEAHESESMRRPSQRMRSRPQPAPTLRPPPLQPQRWRASTSDSKPQALRRYADSMASSSSSSTATPRLIATGGVMGRHESLPLEAIEEKNSLDSLESVFDGLPDAGSMGSLGLPLPLRPAAISRKMSCASTVSATESEGGGGDAEPEEEDDEDDHKEERARDSASSSAWDDGRQQEEGEDNGDCVALGEPGTPPARLNLQAVVFACSAAENKAAERKQLPGKRTLAAPSEAPPSKAPPSSPPVPRRAALYQITEHERRVMQQIADLELAIQKHQSELPALLERLQQTQRLATRLRDEAHESQLRVLQYQKAQRVVTRAVRSAKALMREREYQAAILELLRAAGIDRASAGVWHLLAECRLQVAQLDAAEHACRKSIRLRQQLPPPQSRDVRAGMALLGRILHAQGRQDEAIECYLTALER